MTSPWILLLLAGLIEVVWASGLRYAFRDNLWITLGVVAAMAASFSLLSMAMRSIPVGTAYAIWTGIGAIGVLIVGIVAYREPLTLFRVASALLIVAGIVGLKLASNQPA
jgi:quaternary ammonium compound-resistance protein SugE